MTRFPKYMKVIHPGEDEVLLMAQMTESTLGGTLNRRAARVSPLFKNN